MPKWDAPSCTLVEQYIYAKTSQRFFKDNNFDDLDSFSWSKVAKTANIQYKSREKCIRTGIPIVDIILTLKEYGLNTGDINHLEWIRYPDSEKINYDATNNPQKVAEYMRSLANRLEAQL